MVPDRGRTRGCRCRPGHSSSWYSSSWCLSHGELKKGTGTECGRRGESSARLSPEPCIFMHIQSIRRFRYYSSSTSHDALIFVVRNCACLLILIKSTEAFPLVTRQVRSYCCYVSHRFIATGTRYHRTTTNMRYHRLITVLLLYTTTTTTQT